MVIPTMTTSAHNRPPSIFYLYLGNWFNHPHKSCKPGFGVILLWTPCHALFASSLFEHLPLDVFPVFPWRGPGTPGADISIFGDSDVDPCSNTNRDTDPASDTNGDIETNANIKFTATWGLVKRKMQLQELTWKKMFAKTNFYHTLDLKHSPPCWYIVTRRSSFQCSRLVSRYCYQQQHRQIPRVLSTTIPIRNCSQLLWTSSLYRHATNIQSRSCHCPSFSFTNSLIPVVETESFVSIF